MTFTRIIYSAILIGIVAGALLGCMQILSINPIIFAAENFEIEEDHGHSNEQDGHGHSHQTWTPEEGAERTTYTFLSNISAGIGFSAILLALMSQFRKTSNNNISWLQGSLWGLAGFTAVFLAPGIGLPPEIPGVEAAPVQNRQIWWLFAVLSVSIGLGILTFAVNKIKALGLVFLAMPYIVGAPRLGGAEFLHPDPAVVSALTRLHEQFIVASGITNLIFWLVLGIACAFAFNRWLRNIGSTDDYARA
jgi:cobalt transporter subunit CbtA